MLLILGDSSMAYTESHTNSTVCSNIPPSLRLSRSLFQSNISVCHVEVINVKNKMSLNDLQLVKSVYDDNIVSVSYSKKKATKTRSACFPASVNVLSHLKTSQNIAELYYAEYVKRPLLR